MSYAVYFALTFVGCFMSLMLFVFILSWLSDMLFDDIEDEDELPKL